MPTRPKRHKRWYRRFEWILVPMAIWLPVQLSLQSQGEIDAHIAFVMDWVIWSAFLMETLVLALLVRDRGRYLLGNWLNLLIVSFGIPWLWISHTLLPIAQGLRLLILISLLVHVGSFVRTMLRQNRLGPTLVVILVVTCLSGVLVAHFDPAFKSPGEGIWWAWATVTTVGYGDFVPQSWSGRVFAVLLMLMGISLIALLSASLVTYFQAEDDRVAEQMRRRIWTKLNEMDREADARQKHVDTMLAALARMEEESLVRQTHLDLLHGKLDRIEQRLLAASQGHSADDTAKPDQ
ncbi:MAG: potassium channel family protein [Ahniella sp.]|nr:potassium channel family protein [Ahniella sp.]